MPNVKPPRRVERTFVKGVTMVSAPGSSVVGKKQIQQELAAKAKEIFDKPKADPRDLALEAARKAFLARRDFEQDTSNIVDIFTVLSLENDALEAILLLREKL